MSTREEQIAAQRKHLPDHAVGVYDKAMSGKSLRACINARCVDCCGWSKSEVTKCPAMSCPLWHVRPYQVRQKRISGERAVVPAGLLKYQLNMRQEGTHAQPEGEMPHG